MEMNDFIKNFVDQFDELDPSISINEETNFRGLPEWSSLVALSIIAMVDEVYGVTIGGEEIRNSQTIGDLFERVKGKM